MSDDLTEILTSDDMQNALLTLANEIASRACDLADEAVGDQHTTKAEYGTDTTVGTDRARAHVWAKNGTAIHAERKIAPLLQIVANDDAGRNDTHLDGRNKDKFQEWVAAAKAANPAQGTTPPVYEIT